MIQHPSDEYQDIKDIFFGIGDAQDLKKDHLPCAKMLSRIYIELEKATDSNEFLNWLAGYTGNDNKCPAYLIKNGLLLKIDEATYVTPLGQKVGYLLSLMNLER